MLRCQISVHSYENHEEEEVFTQCKKRVASKKVLKKHIEEEHLVHCATCDKDFCSVESVQDHIKKVHEVVACMLCNKGFATREALKKHMEREHSVKCDICNKDFYSEEI